jgi:phage baseplate assembly protein W
VLLPVATSAVIKVSMEQRSYTVGVNIDHIMDAVSIIGATNRGKCLRRRHDGEEMLAVFSC